MKYAVVTTFPNDAWDIYAQEMLTSFTKYWPEDTMLFVQLDDATHKDNVAIATNNKALVAIEPSDACKKFVEENQGKDDPKNYRFQCVRFCHKVFALGAAASTIMDMPEEERPDVLIWLDADVITKKPINEDFLSIAGPQDFVASYIGRKDWDHSECGWVAYNMKNEAGYAFIRSFCEMYETGNVFNLEQWHDSFVFDYLRKEVDKANDKECFFNLAEGVGGVNVWSEILLGEYMEHRKGSMAKIMKKEIKDGEEGSPLVAPGSIQSKDGMHPLRIETKNCVPDDVIQSNVMANLKLIDNWVWNGTKQKDEIVFVSGGYAVDFKHVKKYYDEGYKIACVKHALPRLLEHKIIPWACVLLDPREVDKESTDGVLRADLFNETPKETIYFCGSMIDPRITELLLSRGCTVWGYHANVGADEIKHIPKCYLDSIVDGGSGASTRGLFLLKHLGYDNFILFGYDLCVFEKPDLSKKLPDGNLKHVEQTISVNGEDGRRFTRTFWTEGQFLAQLQELEQIMDYKLLNIVDAHGGDVPLGF